MHQVVRATTNPAKTQAILQAFRRIFGGGFYCIISAAVENGVSEQPFGSEGTRAGTRNRVANTCRLFLETDFWMTIKVGIDGNSTFGWMVVENADQRDETRSVILPLPVMVLEEMCEGGAFDPTVSRYTGTNEIGRKEGTVDVFAARKLTRTNVYHQAVILALSPFRNAIYQTLWDG